MKCISFNCRGLASPAKILAFRRLLNLDKVDLIFLQETLGSNAQSCSLLKGLKLGWTFHALDVQGRFGDMEVGFDGRTMKLLNVWRRSEVIMVDIFSEELGMKLRYVNIYRPYHRCAEFWENLLRSLFLQVDNDIIGGDLNFSIGHAESSGNHAQIDALSNFFVQLLEDHHLIDIPMARLHPT